MEQQALKYLQIRHWNYWWGVYQCGTSTPACPNAVEFALTDDKAGSVPFFHFDFYTLPGLREILRDSSFMEPEDPDYPAFHFTKQRICSWARSPTLSADSITGTLLRIWPSAISPYLQSIPCWIYGRRPLLRTTLYSFYRRFVR